MLPEFAIPRTISGEFLYRLQQLTWPGPAPGPVGAIIEVKEKERECYEMDTNKVHGLSALHNSSISGPASPYHGNFNSSNI